MLLIKVERVGLFIPRKFPVTTLREPTDTENHCAISPHREGPPRPGGPSIEGYPAPNLSSPVSSQAPGRSAGVDAE